MAKTLTENQARALWMLNSHHLEPSEGYMLLAELDSWGFNSLELQNLKRQLLGGLSARGFVELHNLGTSRVIGFRLTDKAYPALSRWLHLEGGEEIVSKWY